MKQLELPNWIYFLACARKRGNPYVTEIAKRIDVFQATAYKLSKLLSDAGLIKREHDGRLVRIICTYEGCRFIDPLMSYFNNKGSWRVHDEASKNI